MLLNILKSQVSIPSGNNPQGGGFSALQLDSSSYVTCDTNLIDWLSFRPGTDSGKSINLFRYNQDGEFITIPTLDTPSTIANGGGAVTPGITSSPPNILILSNAGLGNVMNISSNGAGNFSNSFASFNQAGTGQGPLVDPASWSIDIVTPLAGVSINLGTGPNAPGNISAPFAWDTSSTTGIFAFVVNATSVDGLTTNQLFIWNVFNQV
jgi:hypothetical protein